MSRADRKAYFKQREQERRIEARQRLDEPMLELMGKLRHYTLGAALQDDPSRNCTAGKTG